MTAITIINLFLAPCLVTILIGGAILNYKYIEKNVYQKYLISTLLFWAVVMVFAYIKFFADGEPTISYIGDVCSVQVVLLGIPCFFSLVCYPVVILDAGFLTLRRWFLALLPLIVTTVIYFSYHLIAGIDPFVKYESLAQLFAHIGSVSVILRLLMLVTLIGVAIIAMTRIWLLVPSYNQYVHDNFADSDYNVDWIRRLIIYVSISTSIYLFVLFWGSVYTNLLYLASVILLFVYIVRMSLFHRTSECIRQLIINRDSTSRGYMVIGEKRVEPTLSSEHKRIDVTIEMLNEWMISSEPYRRVDFTTDDIFEAFPTLIHQDLTEIFRSHNHTFQSYVKRFRIIKACEIIDTNNDGLYPKQTFAMVGFSHHSSFSRSFVSLIGMPPSDYLRLSEQERAIALAKFLKNQ